MILSAAQFAPEDGNIDKNLGFHYNLIDLAYTHQVQLIVFPELSITGYMREEALNHAFTLNDTRLGGLRKQARDYRMTIVVGAPVKVADKLFIGSFILQPDNTVEVYTKHFLHEGEDVAFEASKDFNPLINVNNKKFAMAICYDIEVDDHVNMVCDLKADCYMASIFYSKNGIQSGHDRLTNISGKHNMNVLMSNFCGASYGIEAGGRSAFWNSTGNLIDEMDEESQGLLIVEEKNDSWNGTTIYTNYE